ncbi:HAMP domain-containing histidine kinase (plasmid) [Halorarum halophilum]|uniref:histidine kinase n=1 Tax=Halorarum halophilum TaxID=2743090 RepID=A0A7D5GPN5_9EURY|nr:HAMP domain-containing sensor histidine kinase [Halobaculum halophilum]QLG29924.1 HAMP domain-containing histidine kinase [Halobaculum halophilum]
MTLLVLLSGDASLSVRFLQILLPLVLSIGICVFGGWLVSEDVSTSVIWMTTKAILIGAGLFAFIVFWLVTVQQGDGMDFSSRAISYLNAVLFGMAMSAIVGYLYAQRRAQTDRLHDQRTQLSAQTERLDEFASLVSHDLRNPLTVAQGHLELAAEARDPTDHIEQSAAALNRMDELISGMLTLARHGQIIETTSPVRLETAARTAWGYIQAPNAELLVEGDLTIEADATRLKQVFENLFRNAVEHGGSDVVVRVGAIGSSGFYVEDSGTGFPDTDVSDLFEMGVSTDQQGTGYGLAIVKAIVDAHGWSIRATKGSAGGARFEIVT